MRIIRKNLNVLILIMSLLFGNIAMAQESVLTGKVTDSSSGESLPGVSIVIKGTTNGTITDLDGIFSLNVTMGDVVQFSFVGFKMQEVTVQGQKNLAIALETDREELSEVVVIGYGQVKKSDATGSIVAVSSKDFNKGAITTPQDLLVGKTAGVVITSAGGAPGSGSTIRIRGGSSLNASNDPLIIIDGVPLANNTISGSSNFLAFVNPNDIETFTVLKDASATAIYGSRASNGVILITTKKGKAGSPMKITYDGNVSVSSAIKTMDVYTGDELRQIAKDKEDLFGADSYSKLGTQNTDWQNEIYRTSVSQDHNVSISGAYKTLPYRVAIGYTDQNGILKNTDLQRITGSVSLDPTLLDGNLKINMNAKGMSTKNNFGDVGAVGSAINMDPTQPIKDGNPLSDGYFQWPNYGASLGTPNPVEQLLAADNKSDVQQIIANIQLNYKMPFLPELRANLNLGTDYITSEGHNNRPTTSPSTLTNPLAWGKLNDYSGKNQNDVLDFYLNYVKDLTGIASKIDVTAGYSWQHFQREGDSYTRGIQDETHPYQKSDSTSFITENYLVSFFGRLNYTLKDRYLLTVTVREDGSSRFAEGNQWGLFPSVAFAWKLKEESFLKDVDALSDLKLRLGWGVTGQQDIGNDYPYQAKYITSLPNAYYPIDGLYRPTLRPNTYDPDIKWEETTTQNIGIDFGFLNDRFTGAIDVYKRVTDDLLNTVTIPSGSNFSNTLLTNVGSLENRGAELTLNLMAISKEDMSLNLGFNVSYNENKITKLLLNDDPNYIGILSGGNSFTGPLQVTRVGYPAYSYFMNKQVYDTSGNPIEGMYVDLSGQGGTVNGDNADKYIYHNPAPDYLIGFSARFNYKNFDLSASSRASIGNYVYNQVASSSSYDQMYQIGYFKNFPTYLSDTKFVKRQFTSDYFVNNASFFKLDNITAGYLFDNVFDKMSARVSFTVQNALTITKYEGLDPEVGYAKSGTTEVAGIDNNFYPRPRTFVLGVSLTY
jgi:TonB-dependent starch-binding outer membrane protein SusC